MNIKIVITPPIICALLLITALAISPPYSSENCATVNGHAPDFANQRAPMVALTFDDGPSQHTESILDVLEQYNAKATFFVLGYRTRRNSSTIIRAADLGSEIASHTWTHENLTHLSPAQLVETIQSTSQLIYDITGSPPPSFYRPPFGATNNTVRYVSAQLGYAITNWTLDTIDWRYRNPNTIYHRIMSEVEDGSIILLHDIHLSTAQAMEQVIPSLIAQGFELVTLSELMCYFYGELTPGRIYGRAYDDDLPLQQYGPTFDISKLSPTHTKGVQYDI